MSQDANAWTRNHIYQELSTIARMKTHKGTENLCMALFDRVIHHTRYKITNKHELKNKIGKMTAPKCALSKGWLSD